MTKAIIFIVLCLALLPSCLATSGDLERIVAKIDAVEEGTATTDDLRDEIAAVQEEIEDRTRTGLEGIGTTGAISSLITGVGLAVLNSRRNKTRAKALKGGGSA